MQDWKPNALWKPIKALTPLETLPGASVLEVEPEPPADAVKISPRVRARMRSASAKPIS